MGGADGETTSTDGTRGGGGGSRKPVDGGRRGSRDGASVNMEPAGGGGEVLARATIGWSEKTSNFVRQINRLAEIG